MIRLRTRTFPRRFRWTVVACLVSSWLGLGDRALGQLPDLVVNKDTIDPFLSFEDFPAADCAIEEGCVDGSGRRLLLRFNTETRNIGDGDLVMGNPVGNPLFHFHACHGHYHFEEYADYRLVDAGGRVASGHKNSFCLQDSFRFDRRAKKKAKYTCESQGIQAGWADVYGAQLDCQWIDVTDVPAGTYELVIEVNPELLLDESDVSNNIASIEVVIPEIVAPPNDDCADAVLVADGTTPFNNFAATTDGSEEPDSCNFFGDPQVASDIWYLYDASCTGNLTVSLCGSSFDTELAVYPASACPTEPGSVIACNDDADCALQSEVKFQANAGELFLIRIGGFGGAQGQGTLTITCQEKRGNGNGNNGNGSGNGRD